MAKKQETSGAVSIDTAATEVESKLSTDTAAEEVESKLQKRAGELFKEYPQAAEFHFTSDGMAFFEKSDAINHAKGLTLKEVETIKK